MLRSLTILFTLFCCIESFGQNGQVYFLSDVADENYTVTLNGGTIFSFNQINQGEVAVSWAVRGLTPENALGKMKFYKQDKSSNFRETSPLVMSNTSGKSMYIWRDKTLKGKRTLRVFWADSIPKKLSALEYSVRLPKTVK